MNTISAKKRDELRSLCKDHRVRALYLVGSAATDRFDPDRSDLDFLVEFLPGPRSGFDDVYFRLQQGLSGLFGRNIDLIELPAIRNPYFRESVEASKVLLYAA
ncbi:MAG: nucleotidyltransferase domain-containing protein [Planctomycetes bacterium]|nr:nucleotidyltransferase domain-containing protein [Planctomycetota bacterium]